MKKRNGPKGFPLTLVFSLIVFCILSITVVIAAVAAFILVRMGILTGIWQEFPSANYVILFMVIASMVIGMAVSAISSRIPLKPVTMLVEKMNRLATGDFQVRIDFGKPFGKHPAVAGLSESFNKMAEELEKTEMLRNDFINNFSHEFKTPIVSIAGFAKLLKRGNLTEQQKAEYLDIIEEESLRLSYMATNVLNLTKVENQTILTDVTRYNLSEQLRSCILLLENKWSQKALSFQLNFGEYQILANEELLKQMWINLIDNAVKFSPDQGEIQLKVSEREETISVSVINHGPDISPEDQEKIFLKFYQADQSHSTEGNGVGLAIVKRIAQLHRGSVFVESGGGLTCFTVELPKRETGRLL